MLKRSRTSSSDDDFITPKPSTKRRKIIPPKKVIKSKKITPPSLKITTSSPPASSSSSSDLSRGIQFLNHLENDIADAFSDDVIKEYKPQNFIHPKNLEGCTVDELVKLEGFDERNGEYFKKWLECHGKIEYAINTLRSTPRVHVTTSGRYPSIYDAAQKFHDDTKLTPFNIHSHHVVLRSKEKKKLPSLSCDPLSYSASHLCDTHGCLRKEHLELELFSLNASRKVCSGVVLMVAGNFIIDVNPCIHGTTHPNYKPGGNDLDYACRTIRVEYMPV